MGYYIHLVSEHNTQSLAYVCQKVLIVITSDEKYRFGVPFKVRTKLDCSIVYKFLTIPLV